LAAATAQQRQQACQLLHDSIACCGFLSLLVLLLVMLL